MKQSSIFGFAILLSHLLGGCTLDNRADTESTSSNESQVIGIDISKYQGTVDFDKLKAAGISYIFIRATEGITYRDPYFKSNFNAAQAAGLIVGAYHFYETNDDPTLQLENFTNVATLKPGNLPPVVDIEKLHNQDDSSLAEGIQDFLDGLESQYGVKPIIYSGRNFSNKYLAGFGDYPLWLAEYDVSSPTVPEGWSDWTFWQWSQTSTIEGINGQADADRYNGRKSSFQNLLIK